VIEGNVQNDANATFVRFADQLPHVIQAAQLRIDREVIRNVVAVVTVGREHAHQPEDAHLQVVVRVRISIVEILVKLFRNAFEIPISPGVPIAVSE
jgi:hypothetical protein